jgi:O-antigen/teichoic acid export membrane protein
MSLDQALKYEWGPRLFGTITATQQGVVRESALLVGANIIQRAFGVLRGIIVARLLAPGDYGVLASILVASFYLQTLELGVGWGTSREIPLLRGRQKFAEVDRLEREVFWWELLIGVVVGVGLLACMLWARPGPASLGRAWLALPFYVVAELLRNMLQCFLQAREEFARLRRSMVWQAALDLTLAVVLTWLWGLPGAVAGLVLSSASLVVYLMWDTRHTQLWVPARMEWPLFRVLVAAGLPLMLQNMLWINMTNVDKLVILSRLSTDSLAFYSMAQTIAASVFLVAAGVSRVNGPMMVRRFGETADPATLYGMSYRTVIILAYGLPVLVATMWLLGPTFFSIVLPKYKASVPLLDLTGLTFYGMAITLGVSSLYVALGRQALNGFLLIIGMVLTAGLGLFFIGIGWGVLGVAVASAISACAYVTAFLAIGLRMVGRRGRAFAADLARALFPLAACIGFVACLAVGPKDGPGRTWLAAAILLAASAIAFGGITTSLERSRLEA